MTSTVDYSTTGSNTVILVDEEIHNVYNMLSKLDITKKEIEQYLIQYVQNTKEEAKKSLAKVVNSVHVGRNKAYSTALVEYFSSIVERCDEVLNDDSYIQSIVYD